MTIPSEDYITDHSYVVIMSNSGFYAIIRAISMDGIEVATHEVDSKMYIIKSPWKQFIQHLHVYDEVFIQPGKDENVIDENGLLVIEPRFLVAVSDVLNAIACPRMVYVSHMGAKPLKDEFMDQRQLEGILLHDTFTNRIVHQNPIKTAVNETIENRKLELVLADMTEHSARKYLMTDAIMFENFNFDGLSEIDLKHYGMGLFGKLDALSSSNMIIELKSSNIPDSIPYSNHNIQLNLYQDILQDYIGERPKGKVLYVKNGTMGIKDPKHFDRSKSVVGRNFAYLVLSGRYVPPLLRGELLKTCRSCYKADGCKSLCAGMNMQRDCDLCYFEHDCDKKAWPQQIQNFYDKETSALTLEQNEAKKEEFGGLRSSNSVSTSIDKVQCTKISEHTSHYGKFICEYEYNAQDLRYRSGDYLTIYPKSKSDIVELSYSGKLLVIEDEKMIIEASNSLPEIIEVFPSNTSFLLTRSRETLYKAVNSPSPITKKIIQFLTSSQDNSNSSEFKPLPNNTEELIKPFKDYNAMQKAAINAGLITEDFVVIQGPAGTGKTSVIVELIHQLQLRDNSILVSAFTNQAVDNIAKLLHEHNIDFLRFGRTSSQLSRYSVEQNPDKFKEFIENRKGKVILSTTSTIGKDTYDDLFFDYVLVDEASQMTLANSLMPAIHGEKLILVGDHKQLPPIVISDEAMELDLHISLFERLVPITSRFIMLNEQYRMSDEILKLPNELFYHGKLKSANTKISNQNLDLNSKIGINHSYNVIAIEDVEDSMISQSNTKELIMIVNIVDELLNLNDLRPSDIGIIAPYRAQIALLRKYIPDIKIDTVDRFQGSEADVIIFSSTTTMNVPILSDPRRINVALTRARKKLIILQTNPSKIHNSNLMRSIYRDSFRRGRFIEIRSDSFEEFQNNFEQIIEDKGFTSLSDPLKPVLLDQQVKGIIFYGSIPLVNIKLEEYDRCQICYKETKTGIQCHGCSYIYHEAHLFEWVRQRHKCPVCKHKLKIIQP